MAATCSTSSALATARRLGGRVRHWQYPLRETPRIWLSRVTLYWSRCSSIHASRREVRRRFLTNFEIELRTGELLAQLAVLRFKFADRARCSGGARFTGARLANVTGTAATPTPVARPCHRHTKPARRLVLQPSVQTGNYQYFCRARNRGMVIPLLSGRSAS